MHLIIGQDTPPVSDPSLSEEARCGRLPLVESLESFLLPQPMEARVFDSPSAARRILGKAAKGNDLGKDTIRVRVHGLIANNQGRQRILIEPTRHVAAPVRHPVRQSGMYAQPLVGKHRFRIPHDPYRTVDVALQVVCVGNGNVEGVAYDVDGPGKAGLSKQRRAVRQEQRGFVGLREGGGVRLQRQQLLKAGPEPQDFLLGHHRGGNAEQFVECKAAVDVEVDERVDGNGLVAFGQVVGQQRPQPGAAGLGVGREQNQGHIGFRPARAGGPPPRRPPRRAGRHGAAEGCARPPHAGRLRP